MVSVSGHFKVGRDVWGWIFGRGKITVSFTMVIERSPGGQTAGGGQSTSKSTCEVPACTALTAFGDRSASSMSK